MSRFWDWIYRNEYSSHALLRKQIYYSHFCDSAVQGFVATSQKNMKTSVPNIIPVTPVSKSTGPFDLDSDARIFLINFDIVNGYDLMARMLNNHYASLHNADHSKYQHIERATTGDGFLYWYNRAGISLVSRAEGTLIKTPRPGHTSEVWDIPMGSSWREMRREIPFSKTDEMMGYKLSECGIIQWTIFELTHFGHAEAHEVFKKAMSLT